MFPTALSESGPFADVKPKSGKRNVDSAAGERELDCPRWVDT
jgi:hypothetical protein